MTKTVEAVDLGDTGLRIGRIVLGTMTFGSQVGEEEAHAMVRTAYEAGVTMFDTSNNYAGGRSEEILGSAVRDIRDEVALCTKGGSHVDQADSSLAGLGRKALIAAVDGSLHRLGTDRIDVYYLHRPDRAVPFDETLEALADLVGQGKILHVAQSNFAAWQITELNALAEATGAPRFKISQPMYNLLGRRIETEYAECSRYLGLANITYNPLAGGLLTGKHRSDETPKAGTRFSREIYRDRYWNDGLFGAVDRLRVVADDAGIGLVDLSLRWLMHRPLTSAMLLGASSVGQLEANLLAAAGGPLADDVLAACDDVWSTLRGAAPDYNR